jgi:putative iron-dependent peroxidase
MDNFQPGIIAPLPGLANYLSFSLKPQPEIHQALERLLRLADGERIVVGLGYPVVHALESSIEGLRPFPSSLGAGLALPSTQAALWCWLRGEDRGELLHRARRVVIATGAAFQLEGAIDAFQYGGGKDLTGYEDGTENPKGEAALAAAIVQGKGDALDGSSFVAVQQWLHDFTRFEALSPAEQDFAVGRRKSDNEELAEAPPSAHVKRTAQESFDPAAFVLRRSMPWAQGLESGLNFVSFGKSFDAFEAQMKRMAGGEDGIVDALFRFTRPIGGGYFWCPPLVDGRLRLAALQL